jgi:hypothetical protein
MYDIILEYHFQLKITIFSAIELSTSTGPLKYIVLFIQYNYNNKIQIHHAGKKNSKVLQ